MDINCLVDGELQVIDDSLLIRMDGVQDTEQATVTSVEYYLPGRTEHVHRSAHIALKGSGMDLLQGAFA